MASGLTAAQINMITTTLSKTRLATFEVAPGFSAEADALEKYSWHALTSAAFFASLHVCEVAVRNGVDAALTATYGPDWPWKTTFEHSLPNPRGPNFKPKDELLRARAKMAVEATQSSTRSMARRYSASLSRSGAAARFLSPQAWPENRIRVDLGRTENEGLCKERLYSSFKVCAYFLF
jgi:hypothetical protein